MVYYRVDGDHFVDEWLLITLLLLLLLLSFVHKAGAQFLGRPGRLLLRSQRSHSFVQKRFALGEFSIQLSFGPCID